MTPLVRLADLNSDGDNKLLICDIAQKLKVYKGTSLIVEHALLDKPVSQCVTYTDYAMPRVPSISVAAGSHIFIYRHIRPYRKWTCPNVEISEVENRVWDALRSDNITPSEGASQLCEARDTGTQLSSFSLDYIILENEQKRATYIDETRNHELEQLTLLTCMEVLKKDSDEPEAMSLLVVGTEEGVVYILPPDPSGSAFLCKITLKSVPVMLNVTGLFDTEWRIVVGCRDGMIYNIKEGDVRGTAVLTGNVIDTGSQMVAIARQEKLIWVATMDRMVTCYTVRGKKTSAIQIHDDDVSDICVMDIKRMQISNALLVALHSGEMRMYHDNKMLYKFNVEKPVHAIRFGLYGREDNTLVIVHGRGGAITIKIMRRSADMDSSGGFNLATGPPPEQDIPLQIPKKTKLFVEQTQREREQAPDIHRAFQRDLCKMRLETARAYVKTLTTDGATSMGMGGSTGSVLGGNHPEIRIHAQVKGLGPRFMLSVYLQNAGQQPVLGSVLLFSFDAQLYQFGYGSNIVEPDDNDFSGSKKSGNASHAKQCISVPILLPGPRHAVEAELLSIDPNGRAGTVMILLANVRTSVPLLSATVKMPVSEPTIGA
eukprot:CAMPEP_0114427968 /NCGR_PEP_ID=MMETSP0103-20121206/8665_1 /TAXON_ID=37642 ORGANISM="Paraphysomonas imperforata, Strain PA2" /NCGR_SAMPLE_ID=MMETSP0103 /ASSEMBLY_ACC=CAM_ASM_000201 /LENGTH=599 /DNA_ID=CAMNT_0001597133 /DNA_START=109 /DNA_END=1908 /DNA_ORIENTATION=-